MKKVILMAAIGIFCSSAFAGLQVSPSWLNFGDVKLGDYRYESSTVYNFTDKDISLNVSAACFGGFNVSSSFCYNLSPNSSCTIQVEYSPRYEQYDSCDINIYGNGESAYLHVNGRGVKN